MIALAQQLQRYSSLLVYGLYLPYGSLHVSQLHLRLRGIIKNTSNDRRYDTAKLKILEVKQQFQIKLKEQI